MTISTSTNKVVAQGNGATTAFSFAFLMPAAANAVVTVIDNLGNQTVQAATQYSLSGIGNANGGTLNYPLSGSPLPTGWSISLQRVLPLQQLTSLINQAGYFPNVVEGALDSLEMQIQQIAAATAGNVSVQFPAVDPITLNSILPAAAARANMLMSFDASGNVSVVAAAAQSATALATSLANSASTSQGAGQIGFSSAVSYVAGSVGAFLNSFATLVGSTLVGWIQAGTGAVLRTVSSKLRDQVSVLDYGADNTGAVGASAAIQAAFDANGRIHFPDGTYLFDADTVVNDSKIITSSKGAIFKASANNRIFFKSTAHAYFSQIHNARFDANGKTGTVGFDMTNFRLGAGVFNPDFSSLSVGFIGRTGCFGAIIENPCCLNCPAPVQLIANNSGFQIIAPNFDNEAGNGGSGVGVAIDIQSGGGTNIGVRVLGGYTQGYTYGVQDAAIGTVLDDHYGEANVTADVYANGAVGSVYTSGKHFGVVGVAAYKLANSCDAVKIKTPIMASGARSTGVLNSDGSNTNCDADIPNSSASKNLPIGTTTGINLTPYTKSFVVTDASAAALTFTQNATAFYSRHGNAITLCFDITYPATGSGLNAAITLPVAAMAGSIVSGTIGFQTYGQTVSMSGSGSSTFLFNAAGAQLTNANLSGKRLQGTLTYITV